MSDEDPPYQTFDMLEFLGLSAREYMLMRTKWALIHDITWMLEDANFDAATLAADIEEDPATVERWLRGIVRHATMDQLTVLYSAAADRAGWPDLEWIIRGRPEDAP